MEWIIATGQSDEIYISHKNINPAVGIQCCQGTKISCFEYEYTGFASAFIEQKAVVILWQ